MATDSIGDLWVGFYTAGIARFDGLNWFSYGSSNTGTPLYDVTSLAFYSDEEIWVGTHGFGLIHFDGTTWEVYDVYNSDIPSNDVNSVAVEGNGDIWVGTNHGLALFNRVNWFVYDVSNSELPVNNINVVTIDENQNKWIGTSGLVKYDGLNWSVYNTFNSGLPINYVISLTIDENNTKWIGTAYSGLALFNEDGFSSDVMESMQSIVPISIYPNPAMDDLSIKYDGNFEEGFFRAEIFNMAGQLINTYIFYSKNNSINIGQLENGIYLMKVYLNSFQFTKKFVKK